MNIRDLFVPFEDELQLLPSKRVPAPPLIEWTSAFGDFFFREKGADTQILWCDLGYTVTPKRPLPPARRATLGKRVSRAFNGRTFFRVVPFEDGDDWLLVRPKRGLIKSPAQSAAGAVWQWEASFGDGRKQIVWLSQPLAWFEEWLSGQNGLDLDAARLFAPLDAQGRTWAPFGGDERAQSLIAALQTLCFDTQSGITTSIWRLSPTLSGVYIYPDWHPTKPTISPAAQGLLALLKHYLPLQFRRERWLTIGIGGKEQRQVMPVFTVQAVSAHERLEATLLWRDFAREIGLESEVEPLLRELMG